MPSRVEVAVDELYRGHAIHVSRTSHWQAVLVELATGAVLPTKATALPQEGALAAMARARNLVDAYVEGLASRHAA